MSDMIVLPKRRQLLTSTDLGRGSHDSFRAGCCAMELVAYVAGEAWSDHPECVCPVIGAFMRAWNDGLPDDERTEVLRPFLAKVIGTRRDGETERRRALMAADWLVREQTAVWLRLAGLTAQADMVAALPEITDMTQLPSLMPTLEAVRTDVAARRAASWDAVWDAWEASGAGDSTWRAAGVTRDAFLDAVRAAAWDAAWDAWGALGAGDPVRGAVRAAVWDASKVAGNVEGARKKTRLELQASATRLLDRMIAA